MHGQRLCCCENTNLLWELLTDQRHDEGGLSHLGCWRSHEAKKQGRSSQTSLQQTYLKVPTGPLHIEPDFKNCSMVT